MKKAAAILLTVLTAFVLGGCGGDTQTTFRELDGVIYAIEHEQGDPVDFGEEAPAPAEMVCEGESGSDYSVSNGRFSCMNVREIENAGLTLFIIALLVGLGLGFAVAID